MPRRFFLMAENDSRGRSFNPEPAAKVRHRFAAAVAAGSGLNNVVPSTGRGLAS